VQPGVSIVQPAVVAERDVLITNGDAMGGYASAALRSRKARKRGALETKPQPPCRISSKILASIALRTSFARTTPDGSSTVSPRETKSYSEILARTIGRLTIRPSETTFVVHFAFTFLYIRAT
jgi:hypothetical protein